MKIITKSELQNRISRTTKLWNTEKKYVRAFQREIEYCRYKINWHCSGVPNKNRNSNLLNRLSAEIKSARLMQVYHINQTKELKNELRFYQLLLANYKE